MTADVQKPRTRIATFDAVKLFAIFLVIWGHCIMHLQGYHFPIWENPLYRVIASFHMPLFMAISGYFATNVGKVDFKTHFIKKFRQLIVPSLTFGILFCLSWRYVAEGGGSYGNYIKCYWFVKSAFICSIMYFIATRLSHVKTAIAVTLVISQFLFIYRVNVMYPCFLTGVIMARHKDILDRYCWRIFLISLIAYLGCLSFYDYDMASYPLLRLHRYIHVPVLTLLTDMGIHLYKVVMGIAGTISVLALFIGLGKIIPHSRIGDMLCGWGAYTLGVYLLQAIILEHIMMKTMDFSTMGWYTYNLLLTPFLSVIVLIGCLGIVKLIRLSSFGRIYLLGERK